MAKGSGDDILSGMILMWSGAISKIPSGWVLCDGTNGTPSLTDRFVIHADADTGGTNNVDDTGGAHTVTLTTAQTAPHSHNWDLKGTGGSKKGAQEETNNMDATATSSVGSGDAHENRPKFYALAFIMKT